MIDASKTLPGSAKGLESSSEAFGVEHISWPAKRSYIIEDFELQVVENVILSAFTGFFGLGYEYEKLPLLAHRS